MEQERVAKVASLNYVQLEKDLAIVCEILRRDDGREAGLTELERLRERVFQTCFPLADTSVAVLILNQTARENEQMAADLKMTHSWLMSSSVVQGRNSMELASLIPEEVHQTLISNESQRSLRKPSIVKTTFNEVEIEISPPEDQPEQVHLMDLNDTLVPPEVPQEVCSGEHRQDLVEEDTHFLLPSSQKAGRRVSTTLRTKSSGAIVSGILDSMVSGEWRPQKRESYLVYKEEEERGQSIPISQSMENPFKETANQIRLSPSQVKERIAKLKSSEETKIAILRGFRTAVAGSVASFFFMVPVLASFSSFPPWIALTAISVSTTYSGSSIGRCLSEMFGSGFGALMGFAFSYLLAVITPNCEGCSAKMTVGFLGIFTIVFIFSSLGSKFSRWELVTDLISTTFLVIVGVEYHNPSAHDLDARYVFDRSFMIMTGVLVGFLASYIIFPVKGSQRIRSGLKNTLATELRFVMSGILDLYSNPTYHSDNPEDSHAKMSEKKKFIYASASSVFGKSSKMLTLLETTKGEVITAKGHRCKPGFFSGEPYRDVIFCNNQLMYITLTLFYGLHKGGTNASYCHLFASQLTAIGNRLEKMFIALSMLLDSPGYYLDALSHIQVIYSLLDEIEVSHKENLEKSVTLRFPFDHIQAFSHLWSCLKLYLRKSIHLVDAIMALH